MTTTESVMTASEHPLLREPLDVLMSRASELREAAFGARITYSLALELKRRGGGLGAAALCGGGGQGSALLLRRPAQ